MGHQTALAPALMGSTSVTSVRREMHSSYLAYSMSVIVSRALPDVRDGQKPVHRRILYGMFDGNYGSSGPYKKCARIVGDVMGKYHPHGDSSIYEAMVRMGQPFSTRVLLIDGQGNFGSIDGDPPAAMRYTEARLTRIADEAMVSDLREVMADLPGETSNPYVQRTYDGSEMEPTVLPVRFPALLVNGGTGIAVGMATNMPPHNLAEVINGTLAFIDNPAITVDELMRHIPGPDFPTAGIIQGRGAIREAYLTGRGSIAMSSVISIEEGKNGRQSIVITQLPYQVNKTNLMTNIADLVNDNAKKQPGDRNGALDGISDMRDESDENIRIVIDVKRDADPNLIINVLRKQTALSTRFSYNATCLTSKKTPAVLGLVEILREFVAFREEIIRRRTEYRLNKARNELNLQIGLFATRSRVEEVVRNIRTSSDRDEARAKLMAMEFPTRNEDGSLAELGVLIREVDPDIENVPDMFRFDETQAKAVLELRLQRLTAIDQQEVAEKARELFGTIRRLDGILMDRDTLLTVMRNELIEIKAKYSTPRLTVIESAGPSDIDEDELVENKPIVLTLTRLGYVKTTPLDSFREQSRGGKGKTGMDTKDDDVVIKTLVCTTRTNLIFFTTRGIAHTIKAYRLPEAGANGKGRPIVNFLQMRSGESIATVMPAPEGEVGESGSYMVFVTDGGLVRRNDAADFASVNKGGKIAMKLEDQHGNQTAKLIDVLSCTENDDIVLATRGGKAARFPVTEIRVFKGRDAIGIIGIKVAEGDEVISASIVRHFDVTQQEREAFSNGGTCTVKDESGTEKTLTLDSARMAQMAEAEQTLLTVTALGYGKRFSSFDFRTTGRGVQGVWVGQFGETNGDLVACFPVLEADGVVMVTNGGQAIRTRCSEIRVMGRATRGVRLFDLPPGQNIVDVARVPAEETV